jgi:hypothetical protein
MRTLACLLVIQLEADKLKSDKSAVKKETMLTKPCTGILFQAKKL